VPTTCQPPVLVVKITDLRPKYLVDLMDILTQSDLGPKIIKCNKSCKRDNKARLCVQIMRNVCCHHLQLKDVKCNVDVK
jgi:hypothetical protein